MVLSLRIQLQEGLPTFDKVFKVGRNSRDKDQKKANSLFSSKNSSTIWSSRPTKIPTTRYLSVAAMLTVAPVLVCLSLPAKSTMFSLPTRI